ncbi:uncharacterized protein LOC143623296 [Bidens hawaiensis]|uniref:uncharacterized protein LOC143623296 n=1 Tax=Bidens hawaiensis TaxID=980011 RepID=UPI004048F381
MTAHRLILITDILEPTELDVVDRCIRLVIRNGVQELMIDIFNTAKTLNYQLPNTFLSVSMLKFLVIIGCDFPSALLPDDSVNLKSLVLLELMNVNLDGEMIKYIALNWPVLQTVRMIYCTGFTGFCVSGHENLEAIDIYYNTPLKIIDIDAPNLSRLWITNLDGVRVPQINVASRKKLTTMTYMGHSLPILRGYTDFLKNFPYVENFCLCRLSGDNNVKLSSRTLRKLMAQPIHDCKDIELVTPKLDLFVHSTSIMVNYSLVMDLNHLEASIRCELRHQVDSIWFHKLRVFVGKENGFREVCIFQKLLMVERICKERDAGSERDVY